MLAILRQRNFALLWVGGLISMVGDWVLFVGLPYEIYRQTGSTLATGAMVLALLIPRIVFGSVAGVYVDRWDRRRLMITVNLLLAVFLIPLLAVQALGLWVVYVVLVIESALEQLFTPAEVALLPNLLEGGEEQLVPANALSGVNRHLARLIGPLIGGVVVAAGGLNAVALVDAVSFLVAAGADHRHPVHEPAARTAPVAGRGGGLGLAPPHRGVARGAATGVERTGPAGAPRVLRDHEHR